MTKICLSPMPPRGSAAYPPYRYKQILAARGDVRMALKQLIEEEKAYWRGVTFRAEMQKRIAVPSPKPLRVQLSAERIAA